MAIGGHNNWRFTLTHLQTTVPLSALGLGFADVDVDVEGAPVIAVGFGSVLVYGALIFVVLPWLYRDAARAKAAGKAVAEPGWAKVHHGFLFVYSLAVMSAALAEALLLGGGRLPSLAEFVCAPVPAWLRLVSLSFTLSKIDEWVDTVVLFARGGTLHTIGFLHTWHHATTFLLFALVTNYPGTERFGMLLNGFVHTLMYYHFAYRLPLWARPLITAAQIVQLIIVTVIWSVIPFNNGGCSGLYASFALDNPVTYAVPYALVPVYLLFFLRFYYLQYIAVRKGKSVADKSGKGKSA